MREIINTYRKITIVCFLIFIFLIFSRNTSAASGTGLDDYSENYRILLKDINITGTGNISKDEIQGIMNIHPKKKYLIREVAAAIKNLRASGYFTTVDYKLSHEDNNFTLNLAISENPPVASIKFLEDKMLDLSVLHTILSKNTIITGKVYSKSKMDKAIEEFIYYSQYNGIFLFSITYRAMTKGEIVKENAAILFDKDELEKAGLHLIIIIQRIKKMTIGQIRMKGFTCGYKDILNYIKLKEGDRIDSNKDLFFRYKRLKKLGFFDSVLFRFELMQEDTYRLIIDSKEIPLSDINTFITAPPNIGLIFYAEYFNIGIFNSLQRIKVAAGWQSIVRAPIFTIEYTNPYFWKGFFIDAALTKNDKADPIKDQANYKYSREYEARTTAGYNIYSNFFCYLIHSEQYIISSTVNNNFKELNNFGKTDYFLHSTGLMFLFDDVDDNFFITRGFKLYGRYDTYWKNPIAYKAQVSGELYFPLPLVNIIFAVTTRSSYLFTEKNDKITTLTLDSKMRTNVQEITDINNQQIKLTNYSSSELRIPMPDIFERFDSLSFVIFLEAGGAWTDYKMVSLQETRLGTGIGLRLSPRRHYSSFVFQFPAGLYAGYRIGSAKVNTSLISHRDELYYINLSASF